MFSCDDPPSNMTDNKVVGVTKHELSNVAGLSDCTYYFLNRYRRADLIVIRCPNSSTTTRHHCGKNCEQIVTVIDEKEPD